MNTEMYDKMWTEVCLYQLAVPAEAPPVVMNSAVRLVFLSSRYDHITPLLHELHWLKAAERMTTSLLSLSSVGREQHRRILLTNFVSRRISKHDVDYVPPRRHRKSSVVRDYQPSVTELFWLLRLVSGTVLQQPSHPRIVSLPRSS